MRSTVERESVMTGHRARAQHKAFHYTSNKSERYGERWQSRSSRYHVTTVFFLYEMCRYLQSGWMATTKKNTTRCSSRTIMTMMLRSNNWKFIVWRHVEGDERVSSARARGNSIVILRLRSLSQIDWHARKCKSSSARASVLELQWQEEITQSKTQTRFARLSCLSVIIILQYLFMIFSARDRHRSIPNMPHSAPNKSSTFERRQRQTKWKSRDRELERSKEKRKQKSFADVNGGRMQALLKSVEMLELCARRRRDRTNSLTIHNWVEMVITERALRATHSQCVSILTCIALAQASERVRPPSSQHGSLSRFRRLSLHLRARAPSLSSMLACCLLQN